MALASLKHRNRNNTIDLDGYTHENTTSSIPNIRSMEKFNSMTNSISNDTLFDMEMMKKIAKQRKIK